MQNTTRVQFEQMTAHIAKLNGVTDVSKKFTVAPAVQQTLEKRIQESSAFLSAINIYPVRAQQAEKLGLGIMSSIASTTDTKTKRRETTDPTDMDDGKYFCSQTNFDTHISYNKIDAWAMFPEFQTMFRDACLERQALDRIMIGFNGIRRAATSDRAANPLLQDVNVGWLQQYREQSPERVASQGKVANKIQVGQAGDFNNLDALVMDMVANLVAPWHRGRTDLVAIVGGKLLHDKYFPLVNKDQNNSEKMAADLIISQKRIGNLPAVQVPFFPDNAVLVTPLDNLSLYWQQGGRRRSIIENPAQDRIENYESSNDAYVVEDFGAGAVAENIVILEA